MRRGNILINTGTVTNLLNQSTRYHLPSPEFVYYPSAIVNYTMTVLYQFKIKLLSAIDNSQAPAVAAAGPKETSQPAGKIMPLMDLVVAPVQHTVKPRDKEEIEEEEEERSRKKKFFRPKKVLKNVFTRMQGNKRTFAIPYCF